MDTELIGSVQDIITWPNKILNTSCNEVTEFNDTLRDLMIDMYRTMYYKEGIGLAANQIGHSVRMFIVDTRNAEGGTLRQEFINPHIVMENGNILHKEGCLSFPDVRISTPRSETVAIEAYNINGEQFTVAANGIDAICLQHELDHLNGITFYDRLKLSPTKFSMYKRKFNKLKKRSKKHAT